jgi:hypothetical protein
MSVKRAEKGVLRKLLFKRQKLWFSINVLLFLFDITCSNAANITANRKLSARVRWQLNVHNRARKINHGHKYPPDQMVAGHFLTELKDVLAKIIKNLQQEVPGTAGRF